MEARPRHTAAWNNARVRQRRLSIDGLPLVEEFAVTPDPAECAARILSQPYPLWLDSAATEHHTARYSFLMADPEVIIRASGTDTEIFGSATGWSAADPDPLAVARRVLEPFTTDSIPGLPPFQGGLAGYFNYEFGAALNAIEHPRRDPVRRSDVLLALYDWVIAWDHQEDRAWIISTGAPVTDGRPARAEKRLELVKAMLARPAAGRMAVEHLPEAKPPTSGIESTFTPTGYRAAVARVRDYILAGDIFQVNLSQQFTGSLPCAPFDLYNRLRRENPAPFGAYLQTPDLAIISVSPERFLSLESGTGAVETRPIKGTRPRAEDPVRDECLARELQASEKDRAENVMIVDLLRNDLSRVCCPGSIYVPSLCTHEPHPTVHHLVSTVLGKLAPDEDAWSLLAAALPGGSITGAPKHRAMEIIAELEPTPRGIYSGAIGYVGFTGAMDTSIAIRTAVARDGRLSFSAGGGIVADSDPASEYRETLDKARAFTSALTTGIEPEAVAR